MLNAALRASASAAHEKPTKKDPSNCTKTLVGVCSCEQYCKTSVVVMCAPPPRTTTFVFSMLHPLRQSSLLQCVERCYGAEREGAPFPRVRHEEACTGLHHRCGAVYVCTRSAPAPP